MSVITSSAVLGAVESLRRHVRGAVLTPDDGDYAVETACFNTHTVHQAVLVVAADAEDVAAAVRVAAQHGLMVAVQATGHGAAAAGPDSVLISTRRLDGVEVDPVTRTAHVGAGVRWQQVLDAAAPHGLAGLCGSAPGVGVVGYTVGGGLGPLARRFGFAADHVLGLEVVGPDGDRRWVDAASDPDLFWAIRGGGAAFGVVTAMTFRLVEVDTLYAGGLWFDAAHARAVMQVWRELAPTLPERTGTSLALMNLPPMPAIPEPLRGRTVLHVRFTHLGDDAEGAALLAPLRSAAPTIVDTVAPMPYAAIGAVHADPTDPMPVAERGVLLHDLPAEAVDALADVATSGLPLLGVEVRLLGGATARPATTPNAVAGRGAAYSVLALGVLAPPIAAVVPDALEAVVATVRPWATGGSLLNFAGGVGAAPEERARAGWDAGDLERLVRIRKQVDPGNVLGAAARWQPRTLGGPGDRATTWRPRR
jgi:FAD/FMN-containing dehydrogenase